MRLATLPPGLSCLCWLSCLIAYLAGWLAGWLAVTARVSGGRVGVWVVRARRDVVGRRWKLELENEARLAVLRQLA
eukprot:COSAG02_NODE_9155_length_2307_cov_2.737319_3_plen_76_part_00